MKKSIFISIAFLLLLNVLGLAQKQKKVEYSGFFDSYYYRGPLNLTLGVNAAGYMGDLGFMPNPKFAPGFNLGVNYKVWPRTYFGAEFNTYTIGSGVTDTSGNISFTTNIYELIGYGRYDFLDRRIHFKNDINKRPHRIRPFLTLGIGAAYFDPKVAVSDSNFYKNYEVAKTTNVAIVLPASFGLAFYINKRFSLITEFGYRFALTDAFDGINKLNTSGKDSYFTGTFKLQYTFHPFRKRRAKYVAPPAGYGAPANSGGGSSAPKDSTLNAPILPPGEIAPPADSTAKPAGDGAGQIAPPEAPKELTEEEKKKLQEEKEQREWEESAKPKKKESPADKKKEESSGW